jgi:uncharacterized protein
MKKKHVRRKSDTDCSPWETINFRRNKKAPAFKPVLFLFHAKTATAPEYKNFFNIRYGTLRFETTERCCMELRIHSIEKPESINIIIGQAHFIKSVEDIHEALVGAVPGIQFGVAFCEASGPCLVRWSGTSESMAALARKNAFAIGAGHSFYIFLENAFPINVLNAVQAVPEVCNIFCATANPVQLLLADSDQGVGIVGVIDGERSKGIEEEKDIAERKSMVRKFGYKAH